MSERSPAPGSHDCTGDAAAYALGALEPAEADAFRRHLSECVVCRDELAAFRVAVEALPLSAPQYEPPPGLRRRVLATVREDAKAAQAPARRRPRFSAAAFMPRPAFAAAAAVIAVAVGLIGGLEINSGGSGGVHTVAASVGDARLRVSDNRGELLVSHLPTPPRGKIYEVWLVHRGAKAPTPTTTLFSVTHAGTADVGLPGTLAGVSEVLVTPEPAGGSLSPTHAPVIAAQV